MLNSPQNSEIETYIKCHIDRNKDMTGLNFNRRSSTTNKPDKIFRGVPEIKRKGQSEALAH